MGKIFTPERKFSGFQERFWLFGNLISRHRPAEICTATTPSVYVTSVVLDAKRKFVSDVRHQDLLRLHYGRAENIFPARKFPEFQVRFLLFGNLISRPRPAEICTATPTTVYLTFVVLDAKRKFVSDVRHRDSLRLHYDRAENIFPRKIIS